MKHIKITLEIVMINEQMNFCVAEVDAKSKEVDCCDIKEAMKRSIETLQKTYKEMYSDCTKDQEKGKPNKKETSPHH